MLKKLYAALLFAIVALAAAPHAHAQWTVYDPSNYYENTENYYQLYDANANLLQQYQQAVQQYQLFTQQFTGSNYMSSLTAYSSRSIAPSGTPLATVQDRNGNNLSGSSQAFTSWAQATSTGGDQYSRAAVAANSQPLTLPASLPTGVNTPTTTVAQYNNYQTSYGLAEAGLTAAGTANMNVSQRTLALTTLDQSWADTSDQTSSSIAQKTGIATDILARSQMDTNNLLAAQLAQESQQAVIANNSLAEHLQNQSDITTNGVEVDQSWAGDTGTMQGGYTSLNQTIAKQVQQ